MKNRGLNHRRISSIGAASFITDRHSTQLIRTSPVRPETGGEGEEEEGGEVAEEEEEGRRKKKEG